MENQYRASGFGNFGDVKKSEDHTREQMRGLLYNPSQFRKANQTFSGFGRGGRGGFYKNSKRKGGGSMETSADYGSRILQMERVGKHEIAVMFQGFFNPELNSFALPAIGLYLLGQFALGFHLWHGFSSGFQSVGLRHPRYSKWIGGLGKAFSVVVPVLFSAIVVFMYITQA